MSLNKKYELRKIAKAVCRELRNNPTDTEIIMWEVLRKRKLCGKRFNRQYPIFHDLTGRESFFVADFYCHEVRLVIEVDGKIHKYRLTKDKERTGILKLLGITVLRFHNEEVKENLDDVRKRIIECIISLS